MTRNIAPTKEKRPPWIPAKVFDEKKCAEASPKLTPAQKRMQLVRLILGDIERSRARLPPDQKWPTAEAVKQSKARDGQKGERRAPGLTKTPTSLNISEFPFPTSKPSALIRAKKFHRFGELPYELRHIIWQLALDAPQFIEAQFSTNFHGTILINHHDYREILKSVCRESRDIVLSTTLKKPSKMFLALRYPLQITQEDYETTWKKNSTTRLSKRLSFVPERDTIFLRSWDTPSLGFYGYMGVFHHQQYIRHLALPFNMQVHLLSDYNRWASFLAQMSLLQTLTFMLGCDEKGRKAGRYVELRDAEEWFADGRHREVYVDRRIVDITHVPYFLIKEQRQRQRPGHRVVNVRFVAWKRLS